MGFLTDISFGKWKVVPGRNEIHRVVPCMKVGN